MFHRGLRHSDELPARTSPRLDHTSGIDDPECADNYTACDESAAQIDDHLVKGSDGLGVGRELVTGECAGDEQADDGDADEPGDARDRVVDRRADARVAFVDAAQHRRGQRRDGGR